MTTSTSSSTATSYNVSTASSGAASISGLASGIDTSSLITSLMAVEAQPQTDLKTKLTTNQATTGVLQAINTKLAALTTSASTFSTGTALQAATVTSSNTNITATTSATGGPSLGSIAMTVTRAATAQSAEFYGSGTTSTGGWQTGLTSYTGPLSLQLTANGLVTTLAPASYSAADVAAAINGSSAGVTANVITDSANVSHLVLTAATGDYSATATNSTATPPTAAGFSLAFATGGTTDAPTYSTPTSANMANPGVGQDASVTIAGVALTQHSNTFTDTVKGLTITVNPTTTAGSTTTIGVTQNTTAITSSVNTLMSSLADVLKDITLALTAPSVSSGLTASAANGGLLAGNSTLRGVQQALLAVVNSASASTLSSGQNAASAGIQVNEDGTVSVDATTLATFLASNPTVVQSVLTNFGTALSSATADASNPGVGTLSQLVTSYQSDATTLTSEISDWDLRLAARKATLTNQYTAMETALSQLQSQSNALTAALKSIDGTTSS